MWKIVFKVRQKQNEKNEKIIVKKTKTRRLKSIQLLYFYVNFCGQTHFFRHISDGWPCVCASFTWRRDWQQDPLWGEDRLVETVSGPVFCWETLRLGICVDVTLTYITYLEIVADHMTMVFPGDSCLFWQIRHPATLQKLFRNDLRSVT